MSQAITVPSIGAGKTGIVFPHVDIIGSDSAISLAALETLLGSITFNGSTGTYSHGSSMGTRSDPGDDSQTITAAASLVVAVVRTVLSATNPVMTFNYTNQDGTTGRSGSITVPTNAAVGSAFVLTPHFQGGDTGIRSLSSSSPNGLSLSGGASGVIDVYGLLLIGKCIGTSNGIYANLDPLHASTPLWTAVAGDSIGLYRFGTNSTWDALVSLLGVVKD
jgi:hypothetical protein